ncbi:Cytochrome P450 [Dillenia turbinata]|uniref:Cytochrome P450 n=1 Tax=Dillenia turbinata TaxID=194707 RepID=A0AAN8W0T2_9MAGN
MVCDMLLTHSDSPPPPQKAGNYPPGPWGLPIVGNMLDLAGAMPHRNIAKMKEKYGPVIGLKVGAVRTVAITSAKTAAQLFKNYDLDFADRAIVDCMKCHDLHKTIPGLAPYGTFWRVLKRIYTVDMMVAKRLNETVPVRRKCVDQMLAWIDEEALNPHPIDVGRFMSLTAFNIIGTLCFPENCWTRILRKEPSSLRWCERRRMSHAVGEALGIASGYVKERMEEMSKEVVYNRPKDFLDVLIEFEGDGKDELTKLSEHEIGILVLLEKFTTRESVDVERMGVNTRKAVPLMAIPKKCAT